MNRRILLGIIAAALITVFVFLGVQYFGSLSEYAFTVNQPNQKATVLLFEAENGHYHQKAHNPSEAIVDLGNSAETTLKLKDGAYEVVISGEGVEAESLDIYVGGEQDQLTINPRLSRSALDSLLPAEAAAIRLTLLKDIPNLEETQSKYDIDSGKLLEQGQWYGTKITRKSNNADEREVYHVVALKKDGSWSVKTLPPAIVLSAVKYPDIPRAVLLETNNL